MSQNFALRSGNSFEIWNVNNKDGKTAASRQFKPVTKETKGARAMTFSEKYFAVGNGEGVRVYDTKSDEMKIMWSAPHKKSYVLKFSPKQGFLVVYEIYTSSKDTPDAENLFIYTAATGELKMKFTMKKHSEWEPFFSHDDSFFAILINGEVNFYENFVKAPHKLSGKLGGFSISTGTIPHVAIYLRGEKGSPSMTRLFKYPNLDTNPVASKSFSQADRVQMTWNKKGTGCIILTSTDVDSTGASYYGKQALHFLATNGDSYSVPLAADGPIHDVQFSPKSNHFIVVYGNSPAKATLFNLKCDSVFDFGTGIRNSIYFNDFGNLVLFGGFGNLRGNVEVWDLIKKKQVSTSVAVDTTLLQWSPSGDLYFTATTAPRLRQGNNFRVWHYSGSLLYEQMWPDKQELLELTWQQYPDGKFKENSISYEKVEGIQSSQAQASDKKYVPPNVRNMGGSESSAAPISYGPIPGLPPGYSSSKQQNNTKKPKTQANNQVKKETSSSTTTTTTTNNDKADDDKKKVSAIRKKLKDIKVLKEKQEKGEKLDKQQLKKIASESELMAELSSLKIS